MHKTDRGMRALRLAVGVAMVLGLGASGAAAAANDAWITTKAKIALLTTDDLAATGINVDTIDGKITLHGTVPSDAEKTRAASVAKGIDGVTFVNNLLQVVPAKSEERVEAKDDQIEDSVEKALAADKRLAGSDIDVASVNKGVVLLSGSADSMSDHLVALNVAGKVAGVRRVESNVKADDRLTDQSSDDGVAAQAGAAAASVGAKAGAAASSVGATATDLWITSATKMRLLADGDTPALDVNVDTRDGVVTLFGIVPSAAAKQAAEADARKVSGVKDVRNDLQVVADAKRDAVDAQDDEIAKGVEQSLAKSERVDEDGIDVSVKGGVVRLTGTVDSESDRLAAGFVARSTPGVRAVLVEDLQVEETRG
jgi:hyperosmotically inducible protein